MSEEKLHIFLKDLPDPDGAERFLMDLRKEHPLQAKKLLKDEGLYSDLLSLASFSPLLATTLIQNPEYINWLKKQRESAKVAEKDELLESLARFALTNSGLDTNILLARFRRRQLLRIYLNDIRNLGTIAEITEEISNLADAILEYALRIALQELDNRYGSPFETDENGKAKQSSICIAALGKLGSKELNYASDIDLLFIYSSEGTTTGLGDRGAITNREYFVKLAQTVTGLVGGQTGEGAAYRVDLRLRPNGRVGAPAIAVDDAINYYKTSARNWERQVLIRSRAAAGNAEIFERFFSAIESKVFSKDETVANALRNVRLSKEQINIEKTTDRGFDVKLGNGGIREIEFIAQALQLAYGGSDEWIRSPHTLISLNRLFDRKLLTEQEFSQLSDAYDFLRKVEHRLQMENGLQTHLVPANDGRRTALAKRMKFRELSHFDRALMVHTENVHRTFVRIFGTEIVDPKRTPDEPEDSGILPKDAKIPEPEIETDSRAFRMIVSSLEKSDFEAKKGSAAVKTLKAFSNISPNFAEMIVANPSLIESFEDFSENPTDFFESLTESSADELPFPKKLSILRQRWARHLLEIAKLDVFGKISMNESKRMQTQLAEAAINAAIAISVSQLRSRIDPATAKVPFAVMGLGKLGGGGMDYGSDLDLVLVYDDSYPSPDPTATHAEFYHRLVEIFVTSLSSLTRDGLVYRVDLRLRPDGNDGASSSPRSSFLSYLTNRSAIWEWLAYLKIRGAAGDLKLASAIEDEAKRIIHQNALSADPNDLREESLRVRERLEIEKSSRRKSRDIDIKYGEGGMLDVYFATRYLQLRDNVPDDPQDRSTLSTIQKLFDKGSLNEEDFVNFTKGYRFLTKLDHNLRLTVGRSTTLPFANKPALEILAKRMSISSVSDLSEKLAIHRMNIRESFRNLMLD
ncbi:MAG: hypothetical protein KIS76_08915 [Pyrinomonadaceae bacterium]|nr:hypothetical protein [Pyrinomonadaceae bacterium]